eukprot:4351988-Amphidinium_carterae.1
MVEVTESGSQRPQSLAPTRTKWRLISDEKWRPSMPMIEPPLEPSVRVNPFVTNGKLKVPSDAPVKLAKPKGNNRTLMLPVCASMSGKMQ